MKRGVSGDIAFQELYVEVSDLYEYAVRMRGETTDEDLVEKLIWKLEAVLGENK